MAELMTPTELIGLAAQELTALPAMQAGSAVSSCVARPRSSVGVISSAMCHSDSVSEVVSVFLTIPS